MTRVDEVEHPIGEDDAQPLVTPRRAQGEQVGERECGHRNSYSFRQPSEAVSRRKPSVVKCFFKLFTD